MDAPRRHWEIASTATVGGRLTFAALTAFRTAILARRFQLPRHAENRMAERRISLAQLVDAVRVGCICSLGSRRDHICGGYLHGQLMVVVETFCPRGIDFRDLVPTVSTLYEVDAIEPGKPLAVPMDELAHV